MQKDSTQTCKCGCGVSIPEGKVFVNREHYSRWQRKQIELEELQPAEEREIREAPPTNSATKKPNQSIEFDELFESIGNVAAVLVFIAGWVYAIAEFGFFLGLTLGWLPASLLAVIFRVVWPIVLPILTLGAAIVGVALLYLFIKN